MFADRKRPSLGKARTRLPWPKGREFKILSLDGGGIRGIYSSHLLALCEDSFGPAADRFDLIAGTSTGGIIAIGLGLGLSAHTLDDLYVLDGRDVFPADIFRRGYLKKFRWLFRPIHDHKALERHLRSVLGQRMFGESQCRLVIPAFVGPNPQIAVFKTDHHPDYARDWESEAWKVARATSAAPTFFRGHQEQDAFFLDGGIWANNPIVCAVAEALGTYDIVPDQIRIMSIGTGSGAVPISERAVRAGAIGWLGIINTAMFLTSDSALSQARFIVGFDRVLRFDPEPTRPVALDDWATAAGIFPGLAEADFSASESAIAEFFRQTVSPRERFYTI